MSRSSDKLQCDAHACPYDVEFACDCPRCHDPHGTWGIENTFHACALHAAYTRGGAAAASELAASELVHAHRRIYPSRTLHWARIRLAQPEVKTSERESEREKDKNPWAAETITCICGARSRPVNLVATPWAVQNESGFYPIPRLDVDARGTHAAMSWVCAACWEKCRVLFKGLDLDRCVLCQADLNPDCPDSRP